MRLVVRSWARYLLGGAGCSACLLVLTACGASSLNLRSIRWSAVTLPGSVCGATGGIRLHGSKALVRSHRWPVYRTVHVDAGWSPVRYGDIDGDGHDEAALAVDCNDGSGTADGVLAYAQVIFTSSGKSLKVIGVVTPQQQPKPYEPATLLAVRFRPGKVIAQEGWYGRHDETCCPSGITTTDWTLARGVLHAGRPKIKKAPSP